MRDFVKDSLALLAITIFIASASLWAGIITH